MEERKYIDLNKSVYNLCKDDSGIIDILKDLGFKDIGKPGMLETAGRFMTIIAGAKMKGISLEDIKKEFISRGYSIAE